MHALAKVIDSNQVKFQIFDDRLNYFEFDEKAEAPPKNIVQRRLENPGLKSI